MQNLIFIDLKGASALWIKKKKKSSKCNNKQPDNKSVCPHTLHSSEIKWDPEIQITVMPEILRGSSKS